MRLLSVKRLNGTYLFEAAQTLDAFKLIGEVGGLENRVCFEDLLKISLDGETQLGLPRAWDCHFSWLSLSQFKVALNACQNCRIQVGHFLLISGRTFLRSCARHLTCLDTLLNLTIRFVFVGRGVTRCLNGLTIFWDGLECAFFVQLDRVVLGVNAALRLLKSGLELVVRYLTRFRVCCPVEVWGRLFRLRITIWVQIVAIATQLQLTGFAVPLIHAVSLALLIFAGLLREQLLRDFARRIFALSYFNILISAAFWVLRRKSFLLPRLKLVPAVCVIAGIAELASHILLPVATNDGLVFVWIRGCESCLHHLACLKSSLLLSFSSLHHIILSRFGWLGCGNYRSILRVSRWIFDSARFFNLFMIRSCSILSQPAHKIVWTGTHATGRIDRDLVLKLALFANLCLNGQVPAILHLRTSHAAIFSAWTSLGRIARKSACFVTLLLDAVKGCHATVALIHLDSLWISSLLSWRRFAHV